MPLAKETHIDKRIVKFISSHTCFTLATVNNNQPYCASCFYVYQKEMNIFIFKSKKETLHIQNILKNNYVAGTIHPDKLDKARVRGIQFTGKIFEPGNLVLKKAKEEYYRRYPYAITVSGELWTIEPETLKFTDNRLGFGKRLEWRK